jgi:hypothetical protein
MSEQTVRSAIVVMESGGEWPAWLAAYEPFAPSTRVIVQQEDESLSSLAGRLAVRLDELERAGESVDLAIVACSERADDAALAARRDMARSILGAMAERGSGSLWFTESQRKSGGARQALSMLANDLMQEWYESGLTVSVRFGQPSRPPQAFGLQGAVSGVA